MGERKPQSAGAPPILYNLEGAADAIGQSKWTIEELIRQGELIPRYPNSKPGILHTELVEWANRLPVDKPEPKRRRS